MAEREAYKVNLIAPEWQDHERKYRIGFYRDETPNERYINEDLVLNAKDTGKFLNKLDTRLSDDSIRNEWAKGDPDDSLSGTLNDKIFKYEPGFTGVVDDNGDLDLSSVEPDTDYIKDQDARYNISDERKEYSKYLFDNYDDIAKQNQDRPQALEDKLWDHRENSQPHNNPFEDKAANDKIIADYEATNAKDNSNSLLDDLDAAVDDSNHQPTSKPASATKTNDLSR